MIYTLTLNPALDYTVEVENFAVGNINRTASERVFPGGKGLNVSQVLKNLGMESMALGFAAGFTGKELERLLEEKGIKSEMIYSDIGMTRINVKVRSHPETAINGMGPEITSEMLDSMMNQLDKLKSGDVLILSGNAPKNVPDTIYRSIMSSLKDRGIMIVLDAERDQLMMAGSEKPFLIKPNHEELGALFNEKVDSKNRAAELAKSLQTSGFRNILVSMGADGAVLVTEDGCSYYANNPKGKLVNSVGAGDSMVAGFVYGYLKDGDFREALRYGVATGSASAFSEELAKGEEVNTLIDQVKIMDI